MSDSNLVTDPALADNTPRRYSRGSHARRDSVPNKCSQLLFLDDTHEKGCSVLRLGKHIGSGGFSKCYIARDNNGQVFATKIIQVASISSTSALRHIRHEIQIHKKLCHPFIINFYDVMKTETMFIYVLEYCPNGTMKDLIAKRGRIPEEEFYSILYPIICAVYYLHSNLIHHGDIKPSNILLDSRMIPKLGDFGFSRQLRFPSQMRVDLCGTPAYMAPEIIRKQCSFGLPADIWALGVVTYQLLYGVSAFSAPTISQVYSRISSYDLKFPQVSPAISYDAMSLIKWMLQQRPNKRPSAAQLIRIPWITCERESLSGRRSYEVPSATAYQERPHSGFRQKSKQRLTHMCKAVYMRMNAAKQPDRNRSDTNCS